MWMSHVLMNWTASSYVDGLPRNLQERLLKFLDLLPYIHFKNMPEILEEKDSWELDESGLALEGIQLGTDEERRLVRKLDYTLIPLFAITRAHYSL
jgi:hypothetical protein